MPEQIVFIELIIVSANNFMNQIQNKTFSAKIFSLIIRVRENEKKEFGGGLTSIKRAYYIHRDQIRIILGLYMLKLICPREKETAEFLSYCYRHRRISNGQLFQDVLASYVLPKTHGYFVEFGATDGCFLSNTLFLERQYEWKGLLAEPAKSWGQQLRKNRAACALDFRCVWSQSGAQVEFVEDALPEISGVSRTLNKERMSDKTDHYLVDTVSLLDLLEAHDAPKCIDFMSIDTEGSEFEILEHFDFRQYQIGLIVVEHNYETTKREKILSLLQKNSYRRILPSLSAEDDWYVHTSKNKFQE